MGMTMVHFHPILCVSYSYGVWYYILQIQRHILQWDNDTSKHLLWNITVTTKSLVHFWIQIFLLINIPHQLRQLEMAPIDIYKTIS